MSFLPEYSKFAELFAAEKLEITSEQYSQLETYARLLVEWNEKMNLTGITDPEGIAVKHFLDSILPLNFFAVPENAKLVDVGTGAGFPGLPMKIYRPDIKLTLLDSLNKRINFLSAVCDEAEIKAKCVHARAEEGGRNSEFREKYDVPRRAVLQCRYRHLSGDPGKAGGGQADPCCGSADPDDPKRPAAEAAV